jgi:hypothetical protein
MNSESANPGSITERTISPVGIGTTLNKNTETLLDDGRGSGHGWRVLSQIGDPKHSTAVISVTQKNTATANHQHQSWLKADSDPALRVIRIRLGELHGGQRTPAQIIVARQECPDLRRRGAVGITTDDAYVTVELLAVSAHVAFVHGAGYDEVTVNRQPSTVNRQRSGQGRIPPLDIALHFCG